MIADLQVQRLLTRASFGARPGELTAIDSDPEAWLREQLLLQPDPELEARLRKFPLLALEPTELIVGMESSQMQRAGRAKVSEEAKRAMRERNRDVTTELVGARLVRAVHARSQLREVMVDFWSNHFNIFARKGWVATALPQFDRDAIRLHALGRFGDLLLATARSPAMLFYLDNWMSTTPQGPLRRRRRRRGAGINENYARELLELHTLGVGGGYTQDDVREVARVFTGWTLESRRLPIFRFRDELHDPGRKTVLGARVRGDGAEEAEWLLARLARLPSTAHFLSRKLAVRFIGDNPPPALVERAARHYLETDGDIARVVSLILLSPEFADPARPKLKTPLRFVASALRATGGETDGSRRFATLLKRLGELPHHARTPAGYPETSSHWIDPAAMLERMGLSFALASGRVPGARLGRHWPEGVSAAAPGLRRPEAITVALASPEFQWT
ncbi:MAG: DUF1800 domain-containing protein [Myxococcota bacterium]|nr:DUF1800 domain-containing protein [Myxococcota bacterium]